MAPSVNSLISSRIQYSFPTPSATAWICKNWNFQQKLLIHGACLISSSSWSIQCLFKFQKKLQNIKWCQGWDDDSWNNSLNKLQNQIIFLIEKVSLFGQLNRQGSAPQILQPPPWRLLSGIACNKSKVHFARIQLVPLSNKQAPTAK